MTAGDSRGGGSARLIAFFLPQFHPIPENDAWWGEGFTEWTSVARARPLFRGHYQPHRPADLGQYDLRRSETRGAQAEMARRYGIAGFCYYHYWFGGRRILEQPFDEVLASGEPDFPFCLCWANEPWTRRWDGRSGEVLLPQRYSEADDRDHIDWLCRAFRDPRYLRVEGRPLFLVYRAADLPNAPRTTAIWREFARKAGIGELELCRVDSFPSETAVEPAAQGFDAAVEFHPDWGALSRRRLRDFLLAQSLPDRFSRFISGHRVFDYRRYVARAMQRPAASRTRYPCVMPGWDNTPRRRRGAYVFHDADPATYRRWLERAIRAAASTQREPIVFVNAWNEWGEGNHLEPCERFGRSFLEATLAALRGSGPGELATP